METFEHKTLFFKYKYHTHIIIFYTLPANSFARPLSENNSRFRQENEKKFGFCLPAHVSSWQQNSLQTERKPTVNISVSYLLIWAERVEQEDPHLSDSPRRTAWCRFWICGSEHISHIGSSEWLSSSGRWVLKREKPLIILMSGSDLFKASLKQSNHLRKILFLSNLKEQTFAIFKYLKM